MPVRIAAASRGDRGYAKRDQSEAVTVDGAVARGSHSPCTKVSSSHVVRATDNPLLSKSRAAAGEYELRDGSVTHSESTLKIVGTGTSNFRRLPGPRRLCTNGHDAC